MTPEDAASRLTEALLEPVRQVGTLLAGEVDRLRAEVNELQQHVNGLQDRVAELEDKR